MKILGYRFETRLDFSAPVREHDFALRCMPRSTSVQTVLDAQVVVDPQAKLCGQVDGFGNAVQVGRIAAPHKSFAFVCSGLVMVEPADAAKEPASPLYLRPSGLAAAGPEISAFAEDVLRVGANLSPCEKARKLSAALGYAMGYAEGTTGVDTAAEEAFRGGKGVCQDFSHVLIAALRHMGVAARYVSGFLLGEGKTHAWVEVHDGDAWRGIDPTNQRDVDCDYIALSHGRDFADCPIERGIFVGGASQAQEAHVSVTDDADWRRMDATA